MRSEFSEEESSDKNARLKGLDHQMDMAFADMFGKILAQVRVAAGLGIFRGSSDLSLKKTYFSR